MTNNSTAPPDPGFRYKRWLPFSRYLRPIGLLCAITIVGIGTLALIGWFFGIQTLAGIHSDYFPMAPNTAFLFILLGISLSLLTDVPHWRNWLARLGAGLVLVVAGLRVVEYLAGVNLFVDNIIFRADGEALGFAPVGKMAYFTAVNFIIVGLAFFLVSPPNRRELYNRSAALLATGVMFIGLLFAMGYLYGAPLMYYGTQIPMALNTAISFVIVGIAIHCRTLAHEIAATEGADGIFHTALESSPCGIVVFDQDGTIIFVNLFFERTFGYKRDELIGHPLNYIVPKRLHDNAQKDLIEVLSSHAPLAVQIEEGVYALHKDGREIPIEVRLNPIKTEKGMMILSTVVDITERKRSEEQLKELTEAKDLYVAQLEAANKELDSFSYSVSHDLRAPLRIINGFSQALLEDYAGKLDDIGNDHLRRIRSATLQMGTLIDDLLQLSRLTRSGLNRQQVDLSAIAHAVTENLRERYQQRSVEVVIEENLTAEGDKGLLWVVLDNLLGNAWKYTSKKEHAHIEFGSGVHKGAPTFFVRDDGVGFDMAYAGKLFGAFQRLHAASQFEGTGVGLVTVQRIVHRHGGQVWAEATVDNGATFYFTLKPLNNMGEVNEREDNSAGRGQPRRCAVDPARA